MDTFRERHKFSKLTQELENLDSPIAIKATKLII